MSARVVRVTVGAYAAKRKGRRERDEKKKKLSESYEKEQQRKLPMLRTTTPIYFDIIMACNPI